MDGNRRPSRHAHIAELDDGSALTAEFISAVLAWTLIGWLGDRWLSTTPWLVAVGAVLGFVLGTYLVWLRATSEPDAD